MTRDISTSASARGGPRTCAFGISPEGQGWEDPPMIVRNLHPSPAEMRFFQKAFSFSRQLLTLPQAIQCIARRFATDADLSTIEKLKSSMTRQLAELSFSVVLAGDMPPLSFGRAMALKDEQDRQVLGDDIIVINYESFLAIAELEHEEQETSRRGLEVQVDMLLFYCGFGMANELLSMIWPVLAEDIFGPNANRYWFPTGSWSLDMAPLGGTIEAFVVHIEGVRRDEGRIDPEREPRLLELGMTTVYFPWIDCIGLLRTRTRDTWPDLDGRGPEDMWSYLKFSDVWVTAVLQASVDGELKTVSQPDLVPRYTLTAESKI